MDTESIADNAAFFTRMWMDFATRMMTANSFNPFAPPPQAMRQARGAYLGAVSEFAEKMMRSPQFLSLMKQAMDVGLDFRKQIDEYMTAARHDTQGTASEDIDNLMIDVRHLGSRMNERLDQIEELLHDLGRRLERLESNGRGKGHANGTGADAEQDELRAQRRAHHPQSSEAGKTAKGRRRTKRNSEDSK